MSKLNPVLVGLGIVLGFVFVLVLAAGVFLVVQNGGPVLNSSVVPPTLPSAPMTAIAVASPVPPASVKVTPTTPPKAATGEDLRKQKLQEALKYGGQVLLMGDNTLFTDSRGKELPNGPTDIGPLGPKMQVTVSQRDGSFRQQIFLGLGDYLYARDGKVLYVGGVAESALTADELEKRYQVSYPPETTNLDGGNIPLDDSEEVIIKAVVNWNTPKGPQAALVKIQRKDGTETLLAQKDYGWYIEIWHGLCGWRTTRYLNAGDIGMRFQASIWQGGSPNEHTLVFTDVIPDSQDAERLDRFSTLVNYLHRNGLAVVDFAGMDAPAPQYVELLDPQGVALSQIFGNEWARVVMVPTSPVVMKYNQSGYAARTMWTGNLNPGDVINYKGRQATGNEKLCRLVNRDFFGFGK